MPQGVHCEHITIRMSALQDETALKMQDKTVSETQRKPEQSFTGLTYLSGRLKLSIKNIVYCREQAAASQQERPDGCFQDEKESDDGEYKNTCSG